LWVKQKERGSMSDKNVWFVTGAGRGMGVDIAKAAGAAGHAVVATGRNSEKVSSVLGAHDDLIVVALDVTDPASADAAVQAGADRFGRIDVLVNLDEPPLRFPAGADAVATFENRAKLLLELADANRELSSNLDHDDV
jgi:nucleoside-diphosphate-sugar epimerase